MTRAIYQALIRLHPAAFRERFGSDMLSAFESSDHRRRLIADAALSLARQWFLRAEFQNQPEPAGKAVAGGHMFLLLDQQPGIRPGHWLKGFALSFLSFALTSSLLNHGGQGASIIGSHSSSEYGSRIQGQSDARHLDSEIEVRSEELLDTFKGRTMVSHAYRGIRVLSALDTNHDLVLSADEIANAPVALLSLDRNHDGILVFSECIRPRTAWPYVVPADPMHTNPALAAIDADRDGILSAKEIGNAPVALRTLDKDHDGRLIPEELLSAGQVQSIKEALKQ